MFDFIKKMMPREEKFFDLFEAQAAKSQEAAQSLRAILDGGKQVADNCAKLSRQEEEADHISYEVMQAIRRAFITPFDRSDIKGLSASLDDAIDQMPFAESIHAILMRLPALGHEIGIAEIFDGATERILEVPEIRRRNRMATRAQLGFPATAGDVHAAAKHLMNVPHGEGHMVQARVARGPLQQEQVMVTAIGGTTHEGATPWVTVGELLTAVILTMYVLPVSASKVAVPSWPCLNLGRSVSVTVRSIRTALGFERVAAAVEAPT